MQSSMLGFHTFAHGQEGQDRPGPDRPWKARKDGGQSAQAGGAPLVPTYIYIRCEMFGIQGIGGQGEVVACMQRKRRRSPHARDYICPSVRGEVGNRRCIGG